MEELYRSTPDILDTEAEEYEDSVAEILSDGSDIDAIAGITDDNEDDIIAAQEDPEEEEDQDVIDAAQEVQAFDVGEYADYDIVAVDDEEEAEEDEEDLPALFPDDIDDEEECDEPCEDGECCVEGKCEKCEDDDDDDEEDD